MMLASDHKSDAARLSPTAQRMLALRETVLSEWESRLRATVDEAASLPHPILINTFPTLYDNIAEAISPGYPRKSVNDTNTVASEHGGERARVTNYSHQAVIAEYQLLRWTILDVLNRNGVTLDSNEFFTINSALDDCIQQSANAFVLAQWPCGNASSSPSRMTFAIRCRSSIRQPSCCCMSTIFPGSGTWPPASSAIASAWTA